MGSGGTLNSRLKKIRKELSLIDKDLKTLSDAAASPEPGAGKPKLRSREVQKKDNSRSEVRAGQRSVRSEETPSIRSAAPGRNERKSVLTPQGAGETHGDQRFIEYLSSSFHSGRPLRQERRIQRNKAILMLVIVLLILFVVMYRVFM